MAVGVNIVSQFDSKGIDKALRDLKKLGTSGEKAGYLLKQSFVPALAVLGGLVAGLGFAAKAAIEDEKSQAMLARQMTATTGATDVQIKSMETYIDQLSRAAAVADDVLRPAMASLVRSTKSVEEAQKLMALSLDVSAATGKDLETVSLTLGKAYNGNYTALMKLDPAIKAAMKNATSFRDANEMLTKSFGGAAATAAGTMSGKFAALKISMDEAKESIGAALLPVIAKLVEILKPMALWAEKNTGIILALAGVVGTFAFGIIAANIALKAWNVLALITKGINWALAASYTAVQVAQMGLIVGGVTAAVIGGVYLLNKAFSGHTKTVQNMAYGYRGMQTQLVQTASVMKGVIGDMGRAVEGASGGSSVSGAMVMRTEMLRWAGLAKSFEKVKESAGGAAPAVESLAAAVKDKLSTALDAAKGVLKSAQDAFAGFADGVSKSLTSVFSFTDAEAAGEKTGGGFLAGLRTQIAGILTYTDKIKQLLEMELSQESLAAILAAGQVAGGKIADQLIAGGQTAIDETNALVESMNRAADKVGISAAARWFQSGIDHALNMVNGLQAEIDRLTPKIMAQMDALAAKMKRKVTIDVQVIEHVNRIITNFGGEPIRKMATGGVVTRPTFAMIGEAGPEAVIPLNRANGIGGGDTYNLTVNTVTSDERFGEFMVGKLRELQRRKGSLGLLPS